MKNILSLLVLMAAVGCSSSNASGPGEGGNGSAGGASGAQTSSSGNAGGGASTAASGGGGEASGSGGAGGVSMATPTVHMTVTPTTMKANDTVTASVTVTNFVLEAPVGQPDQPGHGHYHIYLDDASGIDYLVANQVPSIPVQIPQGTSVGAHTLRVSLSGNDHVPLSPPVEQVVDITVVSP